MADGNPMITPTQGWRVTGPGGKALRSLVMNQTRSQLLAEAASLTPDYNKLVETFQKNNLSPATTKMYASAINNEMQDYLTKYRDNPFYAFSREGRDKASKLQRLASDPTFKYDASAYESSKKEYEKAGETLKDYNYDNGYIFVQDKNNPGEFKKISAFDTYDPEKHNAMTADDEYNVLTGHLGFADGREAFKVNMSKISDVRDRLNKEFNDSGYLRKEMEDMDMKTNYYTVMNKFNSFMEKLPLSESDKNAIMSKYIGDKISAGQKPSKKEAQEYMFNFVKDIADFKIYSDEKPSSTSGDGTTGKGTKGVIPLSVFEQNAMTGKPLSFSIDNGRGAAASIPVRHIDSTDFLSSDKKIKTKDFGEQPVRNARDLKFMKVIGQDNLYIPDMTPEGMGKLVPMPASVKQMLGELVMKDGESVYQTMFKDVGDGSHQLIGVGETKASPQNVKSAVFTNFNFLAGRIDKRYEAAYDALALLGYMPNDISEKEWKDIYDNSTDVNKDEDTSSWYNPYNIGQRITSSPIYQSFKIPIFGEYQNEASFNSLYNMPTAFGPKSELVVGPKVQQDNTVNPFVDRQREMTLGQFPGMSSLNNP